MASYTVDSHEVASYGHALVAAAVDTVTFGRDCATVRVYNDTGTAAIYFTIDHSDPTVAGNNTYRVVAAAYANTTVTVPTGGDTVVKLISSGTPTYSVEGSL